MNDAVPTIKPTRRNQMRHQKTMAIITAIAIATLTGCVTQTTPVSASTSVGLPVTVTETGDVRVTAVLGATPQTILTTAAATYNGNPVTIDLGIEYVNMIPDPTVGANGIGFELYEDGNHLERLTLFGNHNSNLNQFGPVYVHVILDGTQTPTAGTHVFSVSVWKWSPNGDGYLRAGDVEGAYAQPMRLTVSQP